MSDLFESYAEDRAAAVAAQARASWALRHPELLGDPDDDTVVCRSCGGERSSEDVTASGICSSCLPGPARGNLTNPGIRARLVPPTPITAAPSARRKIEQIGPGRQAVRAALAEYRTRRDQPTIPTDPKETP